MAIKTTNLQLAFFVGFFNSVEILAFPVSNPDGVWGFPTHQLYRQPVNPEIQSRDWAQVGQGYPSDEIEAGDYPEEDRNFQGGSPFAHTMRLVAPDRMSSGYPPNPNLLLADGMPYPDQGFGATAGLPQFSPAGTSVANGPNGQAVSLDRDADQRGNSAFPTRNANWLPNTGAGVEPIGRSSQREAASQPTSDSRDNNFLNRAQTFPNYPTNQNQQSGDLSQQSGDPNQISSGNQNPPAFGNQNEPSSGNQNQQSSGNQNQNLGFLNHNNVDGQLRKVTYSVDGNGNIVANSAEVVKD